MTHKNYSPTQTLLCLKSGDQVIDLNIHRRSIESTIQRLKNDGTARKWECRKISETEFTITRVK